MTSTTKRTRPPAHRCEQRREPVGERPVKHERAQQYAAEDVTEYMFATVNGRWKVHVVRRSAGAWAVRLGGFALHRDGCFWPAPDQTGHRQPTRPDRAGLGTEPTYPLDEAIARTLHVLVRLP